MYLAQCACFQAARDAPLLPILPHGYLWNVQLTSGVLPSPDRESSSVVKVFKNFKETATLRVSFGAEGLHGGALLAVRSADFVCFYDWNTSKVRRLCWRPPLTQDS